MRLASCLLTVVAALTGCVTFDDDPFAVEPAPTGPGYGSSKGDGGSIADDGSTPDGSSIPPDPSSCPAECNGASLAC